MGAVQLRSNLLKVANVLEAVKTVLVKNGVSAKRVSVRGYGGSKLLLPPVTKRGRDRNERVEFIILKADR